MTHPALTRRRFLAGLAGGASVLLLAACQQAQPSPTAKPAESKPADAKPAAKPAEAAKPADAAKPAASPAAGASPAAAKPSANLDQLIDAAKREGEVHFGDVSLQQFNDKGFAEAFRKKYGLPDSFNVRHTLLGTGDLVTKVQQEVQAGQVTMDLVWIGDLAFWKGLKDGGHLASHQPSELQAVDQMNQKLGFPPHGAPNWYTVVSYCFAPVWNKKFVTKDIKSWKDLIDASFKGKVIQGDIRTSSTQTDTWIQLYKVLGKEYWEQWVATTEPTLIFRTAEMQTKVTSGERILANQHITGRAFQAWREDKSLQFGAVFPSEGVVPLPIQAGVLAKAPHPNAGKLLLEFLVSKEGQQFWVANEGQWPLRTDVTYPDDVKPYLTPLDQVKALTVDWEKEVTAEARNTARAEFRRIFKVS